MIRIRTRTISPVGDTRTGQKHQFPESGVPIHRGGPVWHVTSFLIFLREYLLLAFKHGVQGRADDCCVEKGAHTQEISLRILNLGPSRNAPPLESPLGSALATANRPLRHGGLNRMMEEETKSSRSGAGRKSVVWCGFVFVILWFELGCFIPL